MRNSPPPTATADLGATTVQVPAGSTARLRGRRAIDEEIARLTLESCGARIDTLTDAQRDYLNSWRAAP